MLSMILPLISCVMSMPLGLHLDMVTDRFFLTPRWYICDNHLLKLDCTSFAFLALRALKDRPPGIRGDACHNNIDVIIQMTHILTKHFCEAVLSSPVPMVTSAMDMLDTLLFHSMTFVNKTFRGISTYSPNHARESCCVGHSRPSCPGGSGLSISIKQCQNG